MQLAYPAGSTRVERLRIDARYSVNQYMLASMLSDTQDAHAHRQEAVEIVMSSLDDASALLERSTEDLEHPYIP